jgi:hypothetical protein
MDPGCIKVIAVCHWVPVPAPWTPRVDGRIKVLLAEILATRR